ncbi:MAG: hypothetical protein SFY66_10830 [Oculatellaceae cyanobacterium bins.114]|nr:hypothetical protein [Oculatellaceae cyanobacterium bins.114]
MKKIALVFCIAAITGCSGTSQPLPTASAPTTESPQLQAKLDGYVYLNSASDVGSELIRGMSVFACPSNLFQQFKEIRDRNSSEISDVPGVNEMRHLSAVSEMEDFAKQSCGTPVQSSVNGYYSIEGISPGDYLLFGVNWASGDDQLQRYWLTPVTVQQGQTKSTDLNSNNFGIDGML